MDNLKFIIVDDNYAKKLAGFMSESAGNEKAKTETSVDLISAIAKIDAITDPNSVGVLTDMYLPKDIEHQEDINEGLTVFQEICQFYGVDHEKLSDFMHKLRNAYEQRFENMSDELSLLNKQLSKSDRSINYEPEDSNYVRDLEIELPVTLNDVITGFIRTTNEDYKRLPISHCFNMSIAEFVDNQKRDYQAIQAINEIWNTQVGFKDIPEGSIFTPLRDLGFKEFIPAVREAFLLGLDGGQLLGVRVSEKAHEKNIPVVVVSGNHGIEADALPLVARYLYDKGIIQNSDTCRIVTPEFCVVKDELKPNPQEIIDQHDFFCVNKRFEEYEPFLKQICNLLKNKVCSKLIK